MPRGAPVVRPAPAAGRGVGSGVATGAGAAGVSAAARDLPQRSDAAPRSGRGGSAAVSHAVGEAAASCAAFLAVRVTGGMTGVACKKAQAWRASQRARKKHAQSSHAPNSRFFRGAAAWRQATKPALRHRGAPSACTRVAPALPPPHACAHTQRATQGAARIRSDRACARRQSADDASARAPECFDGVRTTQLQRRKLQRSRTTCACDGARARREGEVGGEGDAQCQQRFKKRRTAFKRAR
jgi:hypothetical protein